MVPESAGTPALLTTASTGSLLGQQRFGDPPSRAKLVERLGAPEAFRLIEAEYVGFGVGAEEVFEFSGAAPARRSSRR